MLLPHKWSKYNSLKYKSPNVTELEHARLTDEMVILLDRYMDKTKMTEEHRRVWNQQYYHCETESDADTDENSSEENVPSNNIPDEGSIGEDSDTESECDSVTLGEENCSDSFDTVSDCNSDNLDGIE